VTSRGEAAAVAHRPAPRTAPRRFSTPRGGSRPLAGRERGSCPMCGWGA
jgi:hypothetical protein